MKKLPAPNLRTYMLTVMYDGGPFKGWQLQGELPTVQLELEQAITKCWGKRYSVHGSGRTDTGVHALGQIAHFRAPEKLKPDVLVRALNDHLHPSVRVLKARMMKENFHARFCAVGKMYRYRIVNDQIFSPFEIGKAHHVPRSLDVEKMKRGAKYLIGEHDFASFTSNPGYARASTVRKIERIGIKERGNIIEFEFKGSGFLYRMVRNLMGALIKVGQEKLEPEDIQRILEKKSRQSAPNTAPACGLYLVKVNYLPKYERPKHAPMYEGDE
jgi:tRNA pseudouridine38-40 synthase